MFPFFIIGLGLSIELVLGNMWFLLSMSLFGVQGYLIGWGRYSSVLSIFWEKCCSFQARNLCILQGLILLKSKFAIRHNGCQFLSAYYNDCLLCCVKIYFWITLCHFKNSDILSKLYTINSVVRNFRELELLAVLGWATTNSYRGLFSMLAYHSRKNLICRETIYIHSGYRILSERNITQYCSLDLLLLLMYILLLVEIIFFVESNLMDIFKVYDPFVWCSASSRVLTIAFLSLGFVTNSHIGCFCWVRLGIRDDSSTSCKRDFIFGLPLQCVVWRESGC